MKKLLALVLTLALAMSTFTACGPKAPAGDASEGTKSMYPGTPGANEITINLGSEPPQLNTVLTTDTTSFSVIRHTMDNLVALDEKDVAIPAAAESWTFDEKTLTYTFKIREGMKWSNGDPVTANDFVFAWTQLLTPKNAAEYSYFAYIFKNAEAFYAGKAKAEDLGFKAVDDHTLTVTLEKPCGYALQMFAFGVFAPMNKTAWETYGEQYGTGADKIVTNGAYKMDSWIHEDSLVLVKNPDYWNAENIKLEKITMKMIKDANAAMNGFKAGELDMIGLNGEQAAAMTAEGYPIQHYNDGSAWYFEFNVKDKNLASAKIRKALTLAIDVESFVKDIVKNSSTVANTFTPGFIASASGTFGDAVAKSKIGYDRSIKAEDLKKLLEEGIKEAGLDKLELSIICDDTDNAQKYAAFFQEQWKTKLGVEVKIEAMPFKSRLQRMQDKQFQIVMAGWGPDYNDPNTFLDLWITDGGNNHTGFSNAEFDKLIADASNEVDPVAREAMFIKAEEIILTEYPIGMLYFRARDYVTSEKLEGVVRTAFSDIQLKMAKTK